MTKSTSRFALAAATGLFAGGLALTPASAADLGGDCCADLEERVAELEATTVRKGNKMQSVELSGHVHRAIVFYDDGAPDTYGALVDPVLGVVPAGVGAWEGSGIRFIDNAAASTRFRVRGSAAVTEGWEIGYVIELGVYSNRSDGSDGINNSFAGRDGASRIAVRVADIWFQTPIGRITTGFGPYASEGIMDANLSDTGAWFAASTGDWFSAGQFRNAAGGVGTGTITIGGVMNINDGPRNDRIRYTSPTFYGFTLHADFGYGNMSGSVNDEAIWDVGVTFEKEFNSIRIAAAIGYVGFDDPDNSSAVVGVIQNVDGDEIAGSVSVMHVPSGIFVNFGATSLDIDVSSGVTPTSDATWWRVQAGIQKRFFSLGDTILTGEYAETDDQDFAIGVVNGLDGSNWGLGIQQNVDAAATELYAGIRVYSVDSVNAANNCGNAAVNTCEDFFVGIAGARVRF